MIFLIEVDGVLRETSIEFRHHWTAQGPDDLARLARITRRDGYLLTGGLRAASPGEAVDGEKLPR